MLRNYLKTAFRNLWRSRGFSALNVVGLAIGLATCLLILIFVMDELSYDRFNKNADRIFRVDSEIKFSGNHFDLATNAAPAAKALEQDYPEVEKAVRFRTQGWQLMRKGNQNLREDAVIFTDSSVFDVFTLPLLSGNPRTALASSHTMVLSERMAKKYFNSTDVVGKTLMVNDNTPYKITGVMVDMPSQSHFHYDFLLSMLDVPEAMDNSRWLSYNFNTYVLLRKGTDPVQFARRLPDMVNKYIGPKLFSDIGTSLDDIKKGGGFFAFSLTPLTSIHLHSNRQSEMEGNSSIQYIYIFSAIAAFILLIACVNFMNLSTARSANRAKEVGIRKVLGSRRGDLVSQFMVESVLISLISMLLALALAWLFLPLFNQLAGKQMSLGLFTRPLLLPAAAVLVLVVGLLAGSYPAFFLSSFQPIAVLKDSRGNQRLRPGKGRGMMFLRWSVAAGFKGSWLRNALVVFQFGISIFLIVGTAVIYRQLTYIHNTDLGFNRSHVLVIQNVSTLNNGVKEFKDELLNIPGVQGATVTGYLPTASERNDDTYFLSPDMDIKKSASLQDWWIDDQYVPVLGMKMVSGRNFSKEFPTDSSAVLVNEATQRFMGVKDAVGQNLYELENENSKKLKVWHIIGVIKDFNFNSLRQVVTPMALFLGNDHGKIALRVNSDNLPRVLGQVQKAWEKRVQSQPFGYTFMDDDFNNIYKSEQQMGGISLSFSLLAIFIACLWLFGLAAYAAEQRTREIGIRKVLGASVTGIISLLSKDFLRLVLIAAVIAFPLAWWTMSHWLQDFAYRISIGWEVFAVAIFLATAIALLTVSLQAVKAALANPIKSLRAE